MKRILIIDDDPIIRKVLKTGLEDEGFKVYELKSGKGSIELIEEESIDLITLDIYMDQQEGLETLMNIRRINKDLPIIIVSSAEEYLNMVIKMGANFAIAKPVDLGILIPKVKELLFP